MYTMTNNFAEASRQIRQNRMAYDRNKQSKLQAIENKPMACVANPKYDTRQNTTMDASVPIGRSGTQHPVYQKDKEDAARRMLHGIPVRSSDRGQLSMLNQILCTANTQNW